MEITIHIPDNLISHYITIILLLLTLLYVLFQKNTNDNSNKKENKNLYIKDNINTLNTSTNTIQNNNNNIDNNSNSTVKNTLNNKNTIIIKKDIENSPVSLFSEKELIPIPIIKVEEKEEQEQQLLPQQLNSSSKPNLKISLDQLINDSNNNNNNNNNNEYNNSKGSSSSDEEQTPVSPVSNSFLSPLNFTTGKKKSKKNQFYYVSTYYSSCDLPNKVMDENEIEQSNLENKDNYLAKQDIKNSDLINNGFQYTKQQLPPPSSIPEDGSSYDDTYLNSSTNLLASSNLNKKNTMGSNKNMVSKSLNDFNQDGTVGNNSNSSKSNKNNESLSNQINSPIESCIKKLKKKKCILPQVLQLKWRVKPKKVLIIKKYNDETVNELIPSLVGWLKDIGVMVIKENGDDDVYNPFVVESLKSNEDPYSIDFIISMGGDGTILHTSSLFKTYIPPILSFSLGSLGFLTAFDYIHHREYIQSVIDGNCFVSYRLRLSCTVVTSDSNGNTTTTTTTTTTNNIGSSGSGNINNNNNNASGSSVGSIASSLGVGGNRHRYQVLNEVTIDRGTNPYLSNLECCCDGKLITIVQADGLIIATSTGSTAYSLSAGGSLVHPTIPAILITPICPHTLSFRPVILPSTSELVIRVPETSRCPVWASFDGKNRQELKRGDFVIIKTSRWAVPVVCKTDESNEWFGKLAQNLNWNLRMVQKQYNIPSVQNSDSDSSGGSGNTSMNTSPLNLSTPITTTTTTTK